MDAGPGAEGKHGPDSVHDPHDFCPDHCSLPGKKRSGNLGPLFRIYRVYMDGNFIFSSSKRLEKMGAPF